MKTELTVRGNRVFVKTPYAPSLVERFRAIPGRSFDGESRSWSFPLVRDVLLMICDVLGIIPAFLPDELRCHVKPTAEALQRIELNVAQFDNWHFFTEPYRHQRVNLARALHSKRWLFADEMGTGKSWVMACRLLKRAGYSLIVCPKSVITGWVEQLWQHAGITSQHPDFVPQLDQRVYICNYERILRNADWFLAQPWHEIVFDEIHRLKNFSAQTTRIARQLSARAEYVYGLSGTPAPNGLEDWLGVLSVIDPTLLPVTTKKDFEARYCVKERLGNDGPWVVRGYRNVHELHGYISQVTSRVTKAECLDLPEKVFETRTVHLQDEQKRVYQEIKKQAVATIQGLRSAGTLTVKNVLTEALRLQQIVGGFVPDDDGCVHELPTKAKLEALDDAIAEAGNKQVVIWAHFNDEVAFLRQHLEQQYDAEVSYLTGKLGSAAARQREIDRFKEGEARFFVGTPAAGGVGVNGLQVSDTIVYYSRSWSLVDWLQSQDRAHRIGQKNRVTIIPLVAAGTIDERIAAALAKKQDLQEMMLSEAEGLF